jgi:hypothetical protein
VEGAGRAVGFGGRVPPRSEARGEFRKPCQMRRPETGRARAREPTGTAPVPGRFWNERSEPLKTSPSRSVLTTAITCPTSFLKAPGWEQTRRATGRSRLKFQSCTARWGRGRTSPAGTALSHHLIAFCFDGEGRSAGRRPCWKCDQDHIHPRASRRRPPGTPAASIRTREALGPARIQWIAA